jgi:hypothetical protein
MAIVDPWETKELAAIQFLLVRCLLPELRGGLRTRIPGSAGTVNRGSGQCRKMLILLVCVGQGRRAGHGSGVRGRGKGARTVQEQAQEIIDEVLVGAAPEGALARARLRRCVFRLPGHPELALLEQLMSRGESYTSLKDLA